MELNPDIKISGFTIVRNAIRLDYPFRESVLSTLPLCDEFIINCGDSDDGTSEYCEALAAEFDKIHVIHSVWQDINQSGGFQLKQQSNRAIQACKGNWCFYIQADEVVHENDYSKITEAINLAHSIKRVDGILFDYLHFYGSYDFQITGRNWYRREVRAFKNFRNIEAYRDAQGFRKGGNRLFVKPSGARVFHYGYVRSSQSLKEKSTQMSKWWGEKPDPKECYQFRRHFGLLRFSQSHPNIMSNRIKRKSIQFDPTKCKRPWSWKEFKNGLTILWERLFPFRIGEFRNYDVI